LITICLAVGLQPSVELVAQTGAEIKYISELGGYVPVRDEKHEKRRSIMSMLQVIFQVSKRLLPL